MKVFDSIKSQKWSGRGIRIEGSNILAFKSARFQHSINVTAGSHTLKMVGKKRTGNGKAWVEIVSTDNKVVFQRQIAFTKSSWTEFSFPFVVSSNIGKCDIKIRREGSSFGSLEFGRITLEREDVVKKIDSSTYRGKRGRSPSKNGNQIYGKSSKAVLVQNKKRSLAFIVPYQIYGGAEVYIKNLIPEIEDDYDISIIYMHKNSLQDNILSAKIKHRLVRSIEQLNGVLISKDYDFVIYYNRGDVYQSLSSLVGNKLIKSRVVEIYHSDFVWPGAVANDRTRRNIDLMLRVSGGLAKDIIGIDDDRKITLPVGIDMDRFQIMEPSEVKDLISVPTDRRKGVIGTVARLSKEKNIAYILDIADQMSDYLFVIVGNGPEAPKLVERIKHLGLDNVLMVGFKKDIHMYYNLFDAFVLPSRIEGTPISIIEAMACGVPVFSTMVGAVSDLVKDGKTGFALTKDPHIDSDIIRENIFNMDVINNAHEYVNKKHDVRRMGQLFNKHLLSLDNFYMKFDNDKRSIALSGEFI
jgi:glycosyltransferase involved in cell wall biosynthesis